MARKAIRKQLAIMPGRKSTFTTVDVKEHYRYNTESVHSFA